MGYIKDEHIILTCWDDKPLKKMRDKIIGNINKAFEGDELPDYSNYISPVLSGLANSTYTLFIPADGSKEGWGTSNAMDEVREQLREDVIRHNARNKERISIISVVDEEDGSFYVRRVVGE